MHALKVHCKLLWVDGFQQQLDPFLGMPGSSCHDFLCIEPWHVGIYTLHAHVHYRIRCLSPAMSAYQTYHAKTVSLLLEITLS